VSLSPGQVVSGKYRVIRLLGDGGMGSVYEAHHEVLGTRVALKLLHPELSRTGVAKRFLQEARASARIKSPHVVGVADADQTPDGLAFIVLEYLEGRTLREHYEDLARDGRRLSFPVALDYVMQMFEGVEAAHEAGIVHRDLKPDNVMITVDGKGLPLLKLLDFGIAKVDELPESTAGPALTRPGALLGTPEYMAPEQVYSAGSADVRSDVFSLGVILFEMLSGRRPVLSDDAQQIAVAYLTGAFTRLEEACPGVPPALAVAVHRALAAQPRDRFASVAEMRAAVEPFAPPRPPSPSRLSLVGSMLPGSLTSAGGAPPRPIPDTYAYPTNRGSATERPPAGIAAPGSPPQSPGAAVTGGGTTIMKSSPPAAGGTRALPQDARAESFGAPTSLLPAGAFAPEYPPMIAPYSNAPAPAPPPPVASAAPPQASPPSFVPEYPPPVAAMAAAPPPALGGWAPPLPVAPAPAGGRTRGIVWVGIALVSLVVAAGITLGVLYYLGWLDPDPPVRPRKPVPTRPVPTHRPGSTLR
jgi:serine/threonine-protein kinase